MKRASYREAIRWVAVNDDTDFMDDFGTMGDAVIESVTVALIIDLFDVERSQALKDLSRAIDKGRRAHR